jgi:UbiD family decarboxylase
LIALAVYRELKNVILVDEDVDLCDTNDVLWAMQTRLYQKQTRMSGRAGRKA